MDTEHLKTAKWYKHSSPNLLQCFFQQLDSKVEKESPAIAQTPTPLTKPQAPTAIDNHEQAPVSNGLEAKLDRLTDVMPLLVETQLKDSNPPHISTPPPPAVAPNPPKPNRERLTQSAEGKVNRAIDRLIEYNNQSGLLHTDKWQIGISVLKKLTGSSQAVIHRVLVQRHQERLNHHQAHQLSTTHNHFHRGKTEVSDVIKL